ncbi:MAG: AAA family ATPase, partial [SAR324 cluster bacterium]|nr:AAA family ATPase [SAR324 cluster bacterium]
MQIEVTIKNYRCFPYDRPAQFTIGDGLTAFLGVNNSGKSSLLKFFYEFRSMFQSLSEPGGALLFALRGIPQAFGPASSVRDIAELFCNSNSRDLEIVLKFSPNQAAEKSALVVPTTTTISIPRSSNTFTATIEPINEDIRWNSVKIDGTNMNLVLARKPIAHISHIFYGFKFLANTMYIASFRNAINFGAAPGYYDIDVGQAFISKWDQYKSGLIIRDINAAIKLTEDIKRIFDFTSLEINATQDNRTLQIIINGKSYTLPELGSGIAQFIQVLASAAMRSPSYILIDEPELNLHAQLQLDFLTTLASYATEGTLFCTHSIGL